MEFLLDNVTVFGLCMKNVYSKGFVFCSNGLELLSKGFEFCSKGFDVLVKGLGPDLGGLVLGGSVIRVTLLKTPRPK